jgi:hypothetical protein
MGNDVHVVTLHGNSADKLKEHNGKFAHMGFPSTFQWTPHVSVDKATHDKLKDSGAKTAHEAGIEFGPAKLLKGKKTLKTYHHEPDSAEPKVPDQGDMTAKIDINKAEKMIPLMKPYVSDAQRRWAHTESGLKALGGKAGVHEWDEATKGKKLPEKVSKSEELIPAANKSTYRELDLHHGTKSKAPFEHFDMKHHASGFYPGVYTSSDSKETEKHGSPVKVGFKGHLFEIKDSKHAEQLQQHVGGGGSGHKLVQKLKDAGYHGIKRGNEHIIFDPAHANIRKSESSIKQLIKSELPLEKGSLQSRTKFSPKGSLSEPHREAMSTWQGAPSADRAGNRENLPNMEGSSRERALHKLSGQTKTKLIGNKRHFLLHRGMSPEEHSSSVKNGTVNHPAQHSSWTPKQNLANNFANPYSKTPGKTVSAWVHEDNVHTVPKQFGAVDRDYAAASGERSNRMANEHEVIVKPGHSSKVESEKDAERPTSRTGDRIHDRPDNTNDAINIKGAKERKTRTLNAHPDDIRSMIGQSNRDVMGDQVKHKKFGKSEDGMSAHIVRDPVKVPTEGPGSYGNVKPHVSHKEMKRLSNPTSPKDIDFHQKQEELHTIHSKTAHDKGDSPLSEKHKKMADMHGAYEGASMFHRNARHAGEGYGDQREGRKTYTDKAKNLHRELSKSESFVKHLIKSEHSLHQYGKALALTGNTLQKYIEDNKGLQKAIEETYED